MSRIEHRRKERGSTAGDNAFSASFGILVKNDDIVEFLLEDGGVIW